MSSELGWDALWEKRLKMSSDLKVEAKNLELILSKVRPGKSINFSEKLAKGMPNPKIEDFKYTICESLIQCLDKDGEYEETYFFRNGKQLNSHQLFQQLITYSILMRNLDWGKYGVTEKGKDICNSLYIALKPLYESLKESGELPTVGSLEEFKVLGGVALKELITQDVEEAENKRLKGNV